MDKDERELVVLFRHMTEEKQKTLLKKLRLLTEKSKEGVFKIAASLAIMFACWHPYIIHGH